MKKDLIVIKFGTASIAKPTGEPDQRILNDIADQIAQLHQHYRIILVSSGAVGAGKKFIKDYEATVSQKKAAAAIGNPILLKLYTESFSKYHITVAQSLLERSHFANREQFLQLKETLEELWENNIIPIANENDVVSNREIKFSDNDELATLIAAGFNSQKLLLCTVSGGLLNQNGELISEVRQLDENIFGLVSKSKSSLGSGGMASKLTFTNLANKMGIEVTIFGLKQPMGIIEALKRQTGTTFYPRKMKPSAKNKWIASGGISVARVFIDLGAESALLSRKSLLTVGISKKEGDFKKGEIIEILNDKGLTVAVGKSRINSESLNLNDSIVLVHADDIVLL